MNHGIAPPELLRLSRPADRRRFAALKRARIRRVDTYEAQLSELFVVRHPELIRQPPSQRDAAIRANLDRTARGIRPEYRGVWAYLPWQRSAVHILPETEFTEVRTNRNRDLITPAEQHAFYDCAVGIAGLSVGGSIALAIVLQGGARHIRIADFDSLELSNMNRVLAGVHELHVPKTTIVARRIWEMNPYARIEVFPDGLTRATVRRFMRGLDVVVDELDQMAVKQLIREEARRLKVAIVSTADNGDTSVVDVERHDLRRTPFFNGRLGSTSYSSFAAMDKLRIIRTITELMGPENVPVRMQDSLPRIGGDLVSVPQLGGTALMGGAATAYAVRRIAAGLPLVSRRGIVSLDEKLTPGFGSAASRRSRARRTRRFAKRYSL